MTVILTHETPDLDALGSLALARRLHPGAAAVVTGGLFAAVATAFNLGRDAIGWMEWDEYARDQRARPENGEAGAVIVDTHTARRLGPAHGLAGQVTEIWDHHAMGDLQAPAGSVRPAGSCVTLLAARLTAQALEPTPLEATLALAGLMSDTGGLLAPEVTAEDFQAAAWLARTADLDRVRELTADPLPPAARALLADLLAQGKVVNLRGRAVLSYQARLPHPLQAAPVASDALEASGVDAVALALNNPEGEGTDVILRGRA
ncbi:MAG TPA: hypothetical protein VHN99_01990, partial [Deinococcales bacterium]|nr:hypothetical protein [Deinococcales bacterium]